jgi:hypothetical protein
MIDTTVFVDTTRHAVESVADTSSAVVADTLASHGEGLEFGHLLDHMKNSQELELPWGSIELPHFQPVHIGDLIIDRKSVV